MQKHLQIKNRISFWQIVFYISISILTLWLILKVTGVIGTPLWLELGVPIASAIASVFAIYQNILEKINTLAVALATLTVKVDHLDRDMEMLRDKVDLLDKMVITIESKI